MSGRPWFAPLVIPMERRLQTAVVAFWIHLLPMCIAVNVLLVCGLWTLWYSDAMGPFTLVIGAAALYALHVATDTRWQRDGARALTFMRSGLMQRMSGLFSGFFPHRTILDGVAEDDFDGALAQYPPSKNYLFCCHPHGVFSLGVWNTFVFNAPQNTFFHKAVHGDAPEFDCTVCTLSANFRLPVWREILLALGFVDASRRTLVHGLARKEAPHRRGRICVLLPGGAAESIDCTSPVLTLRHRQGFVKVALETGASLVPAFSFGETRLYRPIAKPEGPLRRALVYLQKTVGVGLPLVCGRGVFNYCVGIVPHREALTTVIGKPIDIPLRPDFTEEELTKYHSQYVAAVQDLYRRYQPQCDPSCDYTELVLR